MTDATQTKPVKKTGSGPAVVGEAKADFQVILVDDELQVLESECELLDGRDFSVLGFTSALEALSHIKDNADKILYVISDYRMPDLDGMTFRTKVLGVSKDIPFAILSGNFTIGLAKEALASKIAAVIEKPINQANLLEAIRPGLTERRQALDEKAVIKRIFVGESKQILEELEPMVLSLEEPDADLSIVNDIFRLVHTIKGSSSFLENSSLPKYAHCFENLLTNLKSGKTDITESIVSIMLEALDVVKEMLFVIESGERDTFDVEELTKIFTADGKPAKAVARSKADGDQPKKQQKGTEREFLRVPLRTLDEFMELSGEITIVRNVVNKLVKSLEKQYPSNKDLSLVSEMLEEMYKSQSRMVSNVLDMRKVPLFDVFRPFQRMVRDLCKSLAKEVKLKTSGEALRVDTSLGKVIGDCLVHIIRNSMDHGIESAEERVKAGKSSEGLITVTCFENRDEIIVEVKDDGKGLNIDAIREKGVERGLISFDDAKLLSDAQVMQLIFEPGFSTAKKVTDVSGRGVGMDMVKTSIDAIGGHIDVSSSRGKGTHFQLRMPVPKSVLIISVVLVKSAGKVFAFPQERIEHLLQFDSIRKNEYIREMQQSRFLVRDSKLVPLVKLSELLKLKPQPRLQEQEKENECYSLVVVRDDRVHYAIEVDTILDSEEVVVKPLSNVLAGLTCYAGATLVGVGDVCVIIDYEGLAALAGIEKNSAAELQKTEHHVGASVVSEKDYVLYRFAFNDTVFSSRCDSIYRLEHVPAKDVQYSGKTRVINYRNKIMPLLDTCLLLGLEGSVFECLAENSEIPVLVVSAGSNYLGFCVTEFVDVLFVAQTVDAFVRDRSAIDGNLYINGVNYPVVNLQELVPAEYKVTARNEQLIKESASDSAEKADAAKKKPDADSSAVDSNDGIIWVV